MLSHTNTNIITFVHSVKKMRTFTKKKKRKEKKRSVLKRITDTAGCEAKYLLSLIYRVA